MKRLKALVVLILVTCLFSMFAMHADAASYTGTGKSNVKWSYNDGTLTVYGKGTMKDSFPAGGGWDSWVSENIESPSKWKVSRSNIRAIVVKDLQRIGNAGFAHCRVAVTARIADTVKAIGDWGFLDCSSMEAIYIPSSVKKIGRMAFQQCDSLKDVYYAGSESQWKKIAVSSNNDALKKATIHYNTAGIDSAPKPDTNGSNLPKTTIKSMKRTSGTAAVISWKKKNDINGYQVQYSTSKSFKNAKSAMVKNNKTTKVKLKKLKAGKKYYVRMRTYKITSGEKIYSKWSSTEILKKK